MKQWILGLFLLLGSMCCYAQSAGDNDFEALSADDQALLSKIVKLVDEGLSEAVVPDFEQLAKKYPKNYLVQYEYAYNLYMLGRYGEITKMSKSLLKHKNATEQTYQLVGNAYDMTGDRKKAAKIYQDGLKNYPESGSLYMELGTLYLLDNDYMKALEYYNRGILVQPNFASNYYRAANIFFASERGKVWGLTYAEAAVLLAPSNDSRHEEMAQMIVDCLKESITISFGEKSELSVKLVPGRDVQIDDKMQVTYLGFPGVYEAALGQPLRKLFLEKEPFTASLSQLIEIRKGLVENYFSVTDDLYGNSMYLLEFQKKVIEAGHWDAYNYFLFMSSFPDEFEEWYAADNAPLDSFIDWYNNEPFTLGDGRSIDPMQIFDNYRRIDLMEALQIQARLIVDEQDDTDEKDGE